MSNQDRVNIDEVAEERVRAAPPRLGRRRSRAQAPTRRQVLLAKMGQNPSLMAEEIHTEEDLYAVAGAGNGGATEQGIETGGVVVYNGLQRVRMWKPIGRRPDGTTAYRPVLTPANNILMNLGNGFLEACPDCGEDCGDKPNDCPVREPTFHTYCPVCGKDIYDQGTLMQFTPDAEQAADPYLVAVDDIQSSPQSRVREQLRAHMMSYHRHESVQRGLLRPQERNDDPRANLVPQTLDPAGG